jgi:hypothetical protein
MNALDHGAGSLRQAILNANATSGQDNIIFARRVQKITLTSGQLNITDSVNILGPGSNQLTISGNNASRVFAIAPGSGNVTIYGLTVANGRADGTAPGIASVGGGILNEADLALIRVEIANNRAIGNASVTQMLNNFQVTGTAHGGGVANLGTLSVTDSTFTGNQARGGDGSVGPNFPATTFPGLAVGGGLYNQTTATVVDTRFADNLAQGSNGGSGA